MSLHCHARRRFPNQRSRESSFQSTVLLLAVAVCTGCGQANSDRVPVHPVVGQVTLDGKPLANAFVVLHPRQISESDIPSARGVTDEQGRV